MINNNVPDDAETSDRSVVLINDGEGLGVIGSAAAVRQFLLAEGLPSSDLNLPRLTDMLRNGTAGAEIAAGVAENSGRWVKLTKESADLISKHQLMVSSKTGNPMGVVTSKNGGQFLKVVDFAKGPGAALTNPAMLAGAAGLMAQLAMQQAMDEVTDYLAVIDKKLDDVLRGQKDTALARMIGTGLVIDEAVTLRAAGGRVNSVTWSKVQNASSVVAETQAYAILQLKGLAEGLERESKIGLLQVAAKKAESDAQEWLAVLARCSQLQDGLAVLELDRVMAVDPADLDDHRRGLKAARQDRIQLIATTTSDLVRRMHEVAARADDKILLHPSGSPAIVRSNNTINSSITVFETHLGIERDRRDFPSKPWSEAARAVPSQVVGAGVDGAHAARSVGLKVAGRARSAPGFLREKLARGK